MPPAAVDDKSCQASIFTGEFQKILQRYGHSSSFAAVDEMAILKGNYINICQRYILLL